MPMSPVTCDERGRTSLGWLFVAGRVAGKGGAPAAASGRAAGGEAARDLVPERAEAT